MKIKGLLILTFLAAISALHAEDAGLAGKWTTASESDAVSAGGVGGGASMGSSAMCEGPRITPNIPVGPGRPCNDTRLFHVPPRPAELNLKVDALNGTVTGTVAFPFIGIIAGSNTCGKLKIEEGRITGRTLAFTTYRTVNGSRIPARWIGEVTPTGALTIQTFDTLPCSTGPFGAFSQLTGRPFPFSNQFQGERTLVYQRGKAQSKEAGPAGKWWTTDSGLLTALDLKVGDKGKLAGSVNICGNSEFKIDEGTIIGNAMTFTTHSTVNRTKVKQVWTGDLVNDGTLRLSSPISAQCRFASSTTLTFFRTR